MPKDWDNKSSTKYYGKNGGIVDTEGHIGPRQELMAHQSNKVRNADADHTSGEGTTPQCRQ